MCLTTIPGNLNLQVTNTSTPKSFEGRKAVGRRHAPRRPGCRGCPLRTPSGACRDDVIKSGRCGDWVWYVVRSKQRRRLWAKPNNPRTPSQQHWRKQFGAASKKYSQSLTEEQQDACIAAGAKLPCRPRLGDSGCLTGQQYWVHGECAAKVKRGVQNAQTATEGLQTQEILVSTPGTHRHNADITPGPNRRDAGRGGKDEGRSKSEAGSSRVSIRGTRFGARLSQPQHARARREGSIFAAPRTRFGRAAAGTAALRSGLAEGLRRPREESGSQVPQRKMVRRSGCLRPRNAARALERV